MLNKTASQTIDELFEKEAGYVTNLLGKNISKADEAVKSSKEIYDNRRHDLLNKTRGQWIFKRPAYSTRQVNKMTEADRKAVEIAQAQKTKEVGKTFNTRVGTAAVGGVGAGAYHINKPKTQDTQSVEPNYNPNYQSDNYKYMYATASEVVDSLMEKTAVDVKSLMAKIKPAKSGAPKTGLDFHEGERAIDRIKDVALFARSRRANKAMGVVDETQAVDWSNEAFGRNKKFFDNFKADHKVREDIKGKLDSVESEIKAKSDFKTPFKNARPHEVIPDEKKYSQVNKIRKDFRNDVNGDFKVRPDGNLNNQKANLQADLDYTDSVLKKDFKEYQKYRDNETAKSLALYGGIAGAGKITYDIKNSKERKS